MFWDCVIEGLLVVGDKDRSQEKDRGDRRNKANDLVLDRFDRTEQSLESH